MRRVNKLPNILSAVGILFCTCVLVSTVCAAVPVTGFSGIPSYGAVPLGVSFTDLSSDNPTGWAWYFGDEKYKKPWIRVNSTASWSARKSQTSELMPDGSIILMGGFDGSTFYNDVWRSTNLGRTWTLINGSAGWAPRNAQTSVVTPDGSIVLMGGYDGVSYNDVWRSTDQGRTWTRINASAGWVPRSGHASALMPDGSIVLTGGWNGAFLNDTWRSTDYGITWSLMNASSGWSDRCYHSIVALEDSSIVLTGGDATDDFTNDTWRSTDYGATWTLVNASSGWSARFYHGTVVFPDGGIVLIGGESSGRFLNDMWRSADKGATWSQLNTSSEWLPRGAYSSVMMPDGNLVMMGGWDYGFYHDVWRFQTASSLTRNPFHTYRAPGNYPVTLQVKNADGHNSTTKTGYIQAANLPVVTAVSPSRGPVSGGTIVTITGSRFSGATSVKFGEVAGSILRVNSSTKITARSPAHLAGIVDVSVTTLSGTSLASAADGFTYVAQPTITGVSPAGGPSSGGTPVKIYGTGLTDVKTVLFGSTPAYSDSDRVTDTGTVMEAASDGTQITVISPAHVSGIVNVRVVTAGGISPVVAADRFTYFASG